MEGGGDLGEALERDHLVDPGDDPVLLIGLGSGQDNLMERTFTLSPQARPGLSPV